MSVKALSNKELELTQRLQVFFPRGVISEDILTAWNGASRELIAERLKEIFGKHPQSMGEVAVADSVQPSTMYNAADTDLDVWLGHAERFAKEYLKVEVDLRRMFNIPEELPWKSVIPVFDPGNLTNSDMVKVALEGLKLKVYQETGVDRYTGSETNKVPTLHFIENSLRPNEDTMNKSPNQLRKTGKLFLRLRGYGLAFGLHHFVTKEYLDPKTYTWFPEDRLPDGRVASGYWYPGRDGVCFGWGSPGGRGSYGGSRVATPVPLRPGRCAIFG